MPIRQVKLAVAVCLFIAIGECSSVFDFLFHLFPTRETHTQWSCNDTENTTIHEMWVCDQYIECPNGFDEHISTCNKTECYEDEFECGNTGICILGSWLCDGEEDCLQGEDELDCGNKTSPVECSILEEWQCKDGRQCISDDWVCDGDEDCEDSSDENRETCKDRVFCGADYVSCYSPAMCMPSFWICDGNEDCLDGSDEANCTTDTQETETLKCSRGQLPCVDQNGPVCLNTSEQCDGIRHCQDGSDEGDDCFQSCQTEEGGKSLCSQTCEVTSSGPMCFCISGFRLDDDNSTCLDIDECQLPDTSCDQICRNSAGSYKCECASGYGLEIDGKKCKANGKYKPYLHIGLPQTIRRVPLVDGHMAEARMHYEEIPGVETSEGATIIDIDYLYEEETIIWLEESNSSSVIKSMSAFKDVKTLLNVSRTHYTLKRISVDWIGKNVFFTSEKITDEKTNLPCEQHCGKAGLVPMVLKNQTHLSSDGEIHGIAEKLGNIHDIVVVADKGLLFTSEYAEVGRLIAVSMDGSDSWIISHEAVWPIALAYDGPSNHLFWSQSPLTGPAIEQDIFSIRAIQVEPGKTEVKVILSRTIPYYGSAGSISIFESRLHWYDIYRHEVLSVNANTGKAHQVVAKFKEEKDRRNQSFPIAITHPVLQQQVEGNPCSELKCEYACVLSTTNVNDVSSYVRLMPECLCPDKKNYFRVTSECKVQDGVPFLVTLENGIIRTVYEGRQETRRNIPSDDSSANSFTYDPTRKRLYYQTASANSIRYVDVENTDGGSIEVIKDAGPSRHLTIDPASGNIYWIDKNSKISAMSTELIDGDGRKGSLRKTIFDQKFHKPEGLAFDTHRKKLYFIDTAQTFSSLYSLSADGSDLTRVRALSIPSTSKVVQLIYDPYSDRIVFISRGQFDTAIIYSMDVTKNDFILYKTPTSNVTALSVSATSIFTYDSHGDKLYSQRKSKVGFNELVKINNESATTFSYAPEEQRGGGMIYVDPTVFNFTEEMDPCWTGVSQVPTCSHFCFPSTTGYRCECAEGFKMSSDNKSCLKSICGEDEFYCLRRNLTIADAAKRSQKDFPMCIKRHKVCNRVPDCYDGSDEFSDICECPDWAKCILPGADVNKTFECAYPWKCNGKIDCLNYADEMNCPCDSIFDFKCPEETTGFLSLCIRSHMLNDGKKDCLGGGDEPCMPHEYLCRKDMKCILPRMVNDGHRDCSDGEDESYSSTSPPTHSILKLKSMSCEPGQYMCDSGQCIKSVSWVCDERADCDDGSDEGGDCSQACKDFPLSDSHCNGNCYKSPRGPSCTCFSGYQFDHEKKQCVDKDECKSGENDCHQACANTDGSYKCLCYRSYETNGNKCNAAGDNPILLMSTLSGFRKITLRGLKSPELMELNYVNVEAPKKIRPSTFALNQDLEFYWIDGLGSSLYKTNLSTGETLLLTHHLPEINLMLWDWYGKKLFWVNGQDIEIVTNDGQYSTQFLRSENKINGLTIIPAENYLFYSSVTGVRSGKIHKCYISYARCFEFMADDNDIFRSLTVDVVDEELYWVMHYSGKIETAPIKNFYSKREALVEVFTSRAITGLAVFEHTVHWLESEIQADQIDGDGSIPIFEEEKHSHLYSIDKNFLPLDHLSWSGSLSFSSGLQMVHSESQPGLALNFCEIGICKYLCWFTFSTLSCQCPMKRLHSISSASISETQKCEALPVCPSPLSSSGSEMLIEETVLTEGATVMAKCPGEGITRKLVCMKNGTWSKVPTCMKDLQKCNAPVIENAKVKMISNPNAVAISYMETYWEGSVISIQCKQGFVNNAINVTLKCGKDGNWTGNATTCTPKEKAVDATSTYSNHGRTIALILVVLIMLVIIIGLLIWWKQRGGFNCLKRGGFSPRKLSPDHVSLPETTGYHNEGFTVSYSPTNNSTQIE